MNTPTDPPIYDRTMAVTPAGVCLCCQVHLKLAAHQPGCPIPIVEGLMYRVSHGDGRYYDVSSCTGASIHETFVALLDQMDHGELLDSVIEEIGDAHFERDWDMAFTVEVVGSCPIKLGGQFPAALAEQKATRAAADQKNQQQWLHIDRLNRLRTLSTDADENLYTAGGLTTLRDRILNDPRYADLPPVPEKELHELGF